MTPERAAELAEWRRTLNAAPVEWTDNWTDLVWRQWIAVGPLRDAIVATPPARVLGVLDEVERLRAIEAAIYGRMRHTEVSDVTDRPGEPQDVPFKAVMAFLRRHKQEISWGYEESACRCAKWDSAVSRRSFDNHLARAARAELGTPA